MKPAAQLPVASHLDKDALVEAEAHQAQRLLHRLCVGHVRICTFKNKHPERQFRLCAAPPQKMTNMLPTISLSWSVI